MLPSLEQALLRHRTEIRVRWIELLLVEPVTSPLANPITKVFLIAGTLDQVFDAIRRGEPPRPVVLPECPCGNNPHLAYFRAGTQALHEALILVQTEEAELDPGERDSAFAELDSIIRRRARREIEDFCSFCEHRERPAPTRATGIRPMGDAPGAV